MNQYECLEFLSKTQEFTRLAVLAVVNRTNLIALARVRGCKEEITSSDASHECIDYLCAVDLMSFKRCWWFRLVIAQTSPKAIC